MLSSLSERAGVALPVSCGPLELQLPAYLLFSYHLGVRICTSIRVILDLWHECSGDQRDRSQHLAVCRHLTSSHLCFLLELALMASLAESAAWCQKRSRLR